MMKKQKYMANKIQCGLNKIVKIQDVCFHDDEIIQVNYSAIKKEANLSIRHFIDKNKSSLLTLLLQGIEYFSCDSENVGNQSIIASLTIIENSSYEFRNETEAFINRLYSKQIRIPIFNTPERAIERLLKNKFSYLSIQAATGISLECIFKNLRIIKPIRPFLNR